MTGPEEQHEAREIMRPGHMEIRLDFHLERGTARVGLREPWADSASWSPASWAASEERLRQG